MKKGICCAGNMIVDITFADMRLVRMMHSADAAHIIKMGQEMCQTHFLARLKQKIK